MLYSIQATTGERWLSVDPNTRADAIDAVGDIPSAEFRKIFDALYQYDPPELSGIETPTLVVHGEQEAPLVATGPTDRLGRRRRHATRTRGVGPSRQPGPAASVQRGGDRLSRGTPAA